MKIVQSEKTAWEVVTKYVQSHSSFKSVTGILYHARVSGNTIYYTGENRNHGKEEPILKADFEKAFEGLKKISDINTNTIIPIIPNSLYQQRSPFIGLLHSSGIIL